MIPDLQASFVCEDVRVEASGAHTIVGIINGISTPAVPFRVLKICVWTRWCSGNGRFTQVTRVISPDEETELAKATTQFMLDDEAGHAINVNVFAGLEFAIEGAYHIEILLDDELRLRYPLRILAVPQKAT